MKINCNLILKKQHEDLQKLNIIKIHDFKLIKKIRQLSSYYI